MGSDGPIRVLCCVILRINNKSFPLNLSLQVPMRSLKNVD